MCYMLMQWTERHSTAIVLVDDFRNVYGNCENAISSLGSEPPAHTLDVSSRLLLSHQTCFLFNLTLVSLNRKNDLK